MDPKKFNDICEKYITISRLEQVKLKPLDRKCDDCERIVPNRRVDIYIAYLGTGNQRWRKKCLICRRIFAILSKNHK